MKDAPTHAAGIDADIDVDEADETADRKVVEEEQAQIKDFVKGLSADDIKSGNWFTKLAAHAMNAYTEKVDWQYFQDRYAGVPADVIVDQRIKMAALYAALEGGLSAGAYTATVAATIGSLGGASPATVPAAVATMMAGGSQMDGERGVHHESMRAGRVAFQDDSRRAHVDGLPARQHHRVKEYLPHGIGPGRP